MANFTALFPGLPGLTLNAQLYDVNGAAVGSVITSGFSSLPNQPDVYQLLTTIPTGQTGTLIIYVANDPTAYVAFTISPQDLESSAADVWSYYQRALTNTVPGASLVATVAGNALTLIRAVSFDVTLTGLSIPANWAKLYFTVKSNVATPDSQSLIQIVVSNPGVPASDGLLYLQGGPAPSLTYGSLTVDQSNGNVAISITDDATVTVQASSYAYDLKVITSASKSAVLAAGTFTVTATPTLTV